MTPSERQFDEQSVDVHRAYGLASEAIAAVRSSERVHDLQFKTIEREFISVSNRFEGLNQDVANKHEELKQLIGATCEEMRQGFKSYDGKFWGLAIALIGILLAIVGFLVVYVLFPGHS